MTAARRPRSPPLSVVAGTAALAVVAFAVRWAVVGSSADPVGTDGYYYVVQAEHFARTGSLHVPDASWVLRALALPHLVGADPVGGHAVAAALIAASVVPVAVWLGRSVHPIGGWWLGAFAAVSPTLGHLCADFPKNLGLLPPLWAAFAAATVRHLPTRIALVALLVLATATAHRLGAAVCLLAATGSACAQLLRRNIPARTMALALLAALATAAAFAAAALALPGLLHPADLHRVTSQLRTTPWPPRPSPGSPTAPPPSPRPSS